MAQGAERVALVVGNSVYEHAPELLNPTNDATAISEVLENLGFDVIPAFDQTGNAMRNTLREFYGKLGGAKVALFFYAGHGLQLGGKNYLVPVDAQLKNEGDLILEATELSDVLGLMESQAQTNIVFLDACRDNPLARNLARSMGTRSASVGRGLARVESGIGTLIAFATQPGNVALDGEGKHSPFTKSLLEHIETPGIDVAVMLRHVREGVLNQTGGKQVPWSSSSLTGGGFYFAQPVTAKIDFDPDVPPIPTPTAPSTDTTAIELAYWDALKNSDDKELYESYLGKYPNGMFSEVATIKLRKLEQATSETVEVPASAKIESLLVQCQTHFEANRLTSGVGGTAMDCYREVLSKDPSNAEALAGMAGIEKKYNGWAESAIRTNRLDKAKQYLASLQKLNPDGEAVRSLVVDIQKKEEAGKARMAEEERRRQKNFRQKTWANGDRYEGEFKDDKRTGRGTYYWASGNRYEGEFVDGDFNGWGKKYWASGKRYEGEWKNDKRTGRGTFYWANGDRYEGELKDDKRTGRGTFYHANGTWCEGRYLNDLAADATCHYTDGSVTRERQKSDGKWVDL